MAYDPEFYKLYEAYQQEPIVRANHDRMFKFASTLGFEDILDLGCGQYTEFLKHSKCKSYFGIDMNAINSWSDTATIAKGNYRNLYLVSAMLNGRRPDAFVSLFSTEIMADAKENATFYQEIFEKIPSVSQGLVAGFYYWNRKNENPVTENGGLLSYQTNAPLENDLSDKLSETRIEMHTPSTLFGQDVIEVWRFLHRK